MNVVVGAMILQKRETCTVPVILCVFFFRTEIEEFTEAELNDKGSETILFVCI